MPDENRVFDVARPGHASPQATSKPIIVGHHPTMSDPMVASPASADGSHLESAPTRISVQDGSPANIDAPPDDDKPYKPVDYGQSSMASGPFSENTAVEEPEVSEAGPEHDNGAPAIITEPETHNTPAPAPETPPVDETVRETPYGHVEGLHVSEPKRRSPMKKVLLGLLVLIIAAYLAIDSGKIGSGINLPFHIFKQKTPTPAASSVATNQNQASATVSSLPTGFTEYKLAGTSLTFAAPTAWGLPTSSSDPGYTSRSATAKSDGTYAYLVDFATNKNVEVAVTAAKYLPPARDARYYDFLNWCNGTSDGKIYLSTLKFTTTNKVDTPTTASCDVGPLSEATKQDENTIVQLKTKDPQGNVLGDLYTRNLTNPDLPVFRILDKAMTSSSDIRQLLGTVKIPATGGIVAP